jgi:phosphopantetheine adenylyltransferase
VIFSYEQIAASNTDKLLTKAKNDVESFETRYAAIGDFLHRNRQDRDLVTFGQAVMRRFLDKEMM